MSKPKYPHLFDTELSEEPIVNRLHVITEEIEEEFQFVRLVHHLGGIGPWEQFARSEIYFSDSWCRLFGISSEEMFELDSYLRLIDDPVQREQIGEERRALLTRPIGTKWSQSFRIRGQQVQSSAIVAQDGTVVGVDILLK
ncbi:MAG: hypothetical protein ACRC10_06140 [Thermoguttaceae bacterium]